MLIANQENDITVEYITVGEDDVVRTVNNNPRTKLTKADAFTDAVDLLENYNYHLIRE